VTLNDLLISIIALAIKDYMLKLKPTDKTKKIGLIMAISLKSNFVLNNQLGAYPIRVHLPEDKKELAKGL
jgi:hypothetical protein